jgi:transcriptional adapter 2-alpha
MEFAADDAPQDRQLKLQIVDIYNAKLAERERRKAFLVERRLLNYRQNQANDLLLPPDERDLVNRMRLFARFHSPEEHERFLQDLLRAKRLRKEIARLQQYRRMGIQTLTEAERYELDRDRREQHKVALEQKEADDAAKAAAASATSYGADHATGPTLWKEYGSDRRIRKSVNRGDASATVTGKDDTKPAGGGQEEAPAKMDLGDGNGTDQKKPASSEPSNATASGTFRIDSKTPGYDLLSSKEIKLCEKLELLPEVYLEAKKALIAESFRAGIVEEEATPNVDGSIKASNLVKIDVEKRGEVVDFVLKAGFIPKRPNENTSSNVPPRRV